MSFREFPSPVSLTIARWPSPSWTPRRCRPGTTPPPGTPPGRPAAVPIDVTQRPRRWSQNGAEFTRTALRVFDHLSSRSAARVGGQRTPVLEGSEPADVSELVSLLQRRPRPSHELGPGPGWQLPSEGILAKRVAHFESRRPQVGERTTGIPNRAYLRSCSARPTAGGVSLPAT